MADGNISVQEASRLLGWPPQFLRAAIEFEKVPFGVCVRGKRRAFQIRRAELEAYLRGELTTRGGRFPQDSAGEGAQDPEGECAP